MSFAEFDLTGRVAIVTGGGRGIGRAIALTLAEAGADIVVAARTVAEIREVAELVTGMGRSSLALRTDVTDPGQVESLVEGSLQKFGHVDVLVNNAGQYLKSPLVELPGVVLRPPQAPRVTDKRFENQDWKDLMDINLNAMLYCCRAVGPHMLKRGRGKVINVSSNSGVQPAPYLSAYNTSKAAVDMLTRVMALEWAPYGVCVNAIAPGEFHTAMTDFSWSDPGERRKRLERIPLGREGKLRHIGILAVYLASEASDYMTGQVVYLDGGLTAR